MPEDLIRYIMSFMWKCSTCDNYMEMKNTYNPSFVCIDCQYKSIYMSGCFINEVYTSGIR